MKLLVTGAAGQLGSYLVEHYARRGEVVGVDLVKPLYPRVAEVTVEGDIKNQQLMVHLLKDADVVIHCAAFISVEESTVILGPMLQRGWRRACAGVTRASGPFDA